MKLQAYMIKHKLTLKDIEELTGINFRTISLYKRESVTPSLRNARIIKKATNGKVCLEDWKCSK